MISKYLDRQKEKKKKLQQIKEIDDKTWDVYRDVQESIKNNDSDEILIPKMRQFVLNMWQVAHIKRRKENKASLNPAYAFNTIDKSMQELFNSKNMKKTPIGPRFKDAWNAVRDEIITGKFELRDIWGDIKEEILSGEIDKKDTKNIH